MRRYTEYKDSGITWIGEIPAAWNLTRGKNLFRQRNEKGNETEVLLSATQKMGMYPQSELDGVVQVSETADLQKFKTVHVDDFVISLRSFQGGFEISCFEGVCSPAYQVFFATDEIVHLYYKQLFKSFRFIEMINSLTVGIREGKNIQYSDFSNMLITVPPLATQSAIAAYLDRKTAAIDALIADKLRLIDLLKEKRQALISEVVTKGLDPTMPMKDSGIEWIGDITAGWNRTKLKNLLSIPITDGPHETPVILDEGIPFLSAESVKNLRFNFDLKRGYISQIDHERFCLKCKPQRGDIFMIKSGATTGNIAMVETDEEFSVWSPLALIRCDEQKIDRHYMFVFLQSAVFRTEVELFWNYGTQQNIGMEVLGNLYVAYPNIVTQKKIVAFLDAETAQIDSLVANITTQIEKLKEYRQSIISEAVTGKVMVEAKEKVSAQPAKTNLHFKRRVLAAHILNKLWDEPTMGHVKLEKMLFLSEYCAKLDLQTGFNRHAAGPYNPQVLRSIDSQLKKSQWFSYSADTDKSNKYTKLEKSDEYISYFEKYFDEQQRHAVDALIDLFKTAKSRQCEIVATLYGAWNDFLLDGVQPTDDQIIDEILTNWHESKERIERKRWLKALDWMKQQSIMPDGFGVSTKGGQI